MRPSIVLLLAAALAACPKLPPVSGCTPTAQACRPGPVVCSASQRWEPAHDRPCLDGEACVVLTSGVAACVPLADGGSPDADG